MGSFSQFDNLLRPGQATFHLQTLLSNSISLIHTNNNNIINPNHTNTNNTKETEDNQQQQQQQHTETTTSRERRGMNCGYCPLLSISFAHHPSISILSFY